LVDGLERIMVQRSHQKPAQPNWKRHEVPVLDETACTGCGRCCALCPTDCLAMAAHVPWMPRSAACIGCAVCALICPAAALQMTLLDAADEDGGE
jgi:formate hydrogenlyase subunit 6/NADH:ubiquinone oxidoreductase subunit I